MGGGGGCEQQRFRPACASAQSDQHLCYSLIGKYHVKTGYKRNFTILSSLCSSAEETGLSLVFPETPTTGFVTSTPNMVHPLISSQFTVIISFLSPDEKAAIFSHLPSTVISWIANLKMMVQIIPSVIFGLPSTISEKYDPVALNEGSFMNAHGNVLLNLLNKLDKKKIGGREIKCEACRAFYL